MDPQLNSAYQETNENRRLFEHFCRSLTAEELARDVPQATWNVKDYIAHLTTIDLWVGDWFEHKADGRPWPQDAEGGVAFSIDTWNEARIVERKEATVDELFAEAAPYREKLWSHVDRMSPETLAARFKFRDNNITFLRYIQLWAGHDPAHSADMVRALPERKEQADLKAWFAKYGLG